MQYIPKQHVASTWCPLALNNNTQDARMGCVHFFFHPTTRNPGDTPLEDDLLLEDLAEEEGELAGLTVALSEAEALDLASLLEHLLGGSGGDIHEFVSSMQAELDALEVGGVGGVDRYVVWG